MIFGWVLCSGAYGTKLEFVYSTLILKVISYSEKILMRFVTNGKFLFFKNPCFEKDASGYNMHPGFLPTSVKLYDQWNTVQKIPFLKRILMKVPIINRKMGKLGKSMYGFKPTEASRQIYRKRFVLNLCKYQNTSYV